MTITTKLTPHQVEVLKLMAAGAVIHTILLDGRAWMYDEARPGWRGPVLKWKTVMAMEKAGWICNATAPEWRWRGSKYVIVEPRVTR